METLLDSDRGALAAKGAAPRRGRLLPARLRQRAPSHPPPAALPTSATAGAGPRIHLCLTEDNTLTDGFENSPGGFHVIIGSHTTATESGGAFHNQRRRIGHHPNQPALTTGETRLQNIQRNSGCT